MSPRTIRVLAVHADSAVLALLQVLLAHSNDLHVMLCGSTAVEDARGELARRHVDVLLLGEKFGSVSGLEVLCDLRREGLQTPVIVLAESDDDATVASAVRVGAVECLACNTLSGPKLAAALTWALERHAAALPTRGDELQDLCQNLSAAVAPTLEAARASLACVLAESSLSPEQREQLDEARALCRKALGELEHLIEEARNS